jgi:catechol 2,3-dioxygenase-like lactoylglutathione lyase family enzyme
MRRLHRVAALLVAAFTLGAGATPAQYARPVATPTATVSAVAVVGVTVADMDRSLEFYTTVLPFEVVSDIEVADAEFERLEGVFGARARIVRLRLGDEMLELTQYLAPRGRPIPVDSRSEDRWFQHVAIIVSDMDRAYALLRKHKVQHASSGPQRLPDWNPNAGGIKAFYFKDPDDHTLEILEFPNGKGDAKWHRPSDKLFLGLDHTAIVSSSTDASIAFSRDLLGMRVAGESENYGVEQEHLNNVFGARLRITALRAPSGVGIELLEYLAPRDGRPYPADAKANDLLHWQTTLVTSDAEAAARALRARATPFVSPGVVARSDLQLGFRKGLIVRDPDGHAMQIVERN